MGAMHLMCKCPFASLKKGGIVNRQEMSKQREIPTAYNPECHLCPNPISNALKLNAHLRLKVGKQVPRENWIAIWEDDIKQNNAFPIYQLKKTYDPK